MKTTFNLEEIYQIYLRKLGVTEVASSTIKRIEMRRAFFLGCSAMFQSLTIGVTTLNEAEALVAIDSLENQLNEYWQNQLNPESAENGKWCSELVKCDLCGDTHVAVFPAELLESEPLVLECPRCKGMNIFHIIES